MSRNMGKNKCATKPTSFENWDDNTGRKDELMKNVGHRENNTKWKIAIAGKEFEVSRSICLTICLVACLLLLCALSAVIFSFTYNSGNNSVN